MLDLDSIDLENLERELKNATEACGQKKMREEEPSGAPGAKREAELLAQIRDLKMEGNHLRNEIVRLLEEREETKKRLERWKREEEDEDCVPQVGKREWLRCLGAAVLIAPLLSSVGAAAVRQLVSLGITGWGRLAAGGLDPWFCLAVGLLFLYLSGRRPRK